MMMSRRWIYFCLATVLMCCGLVAGVRRDRDVNIVRSRRRSLFDAQMERQHLKQKHLKRINTAEGKLKLVGGSADNEGENVLIPEFALSRPKGVISAGGS